MEVKYDKLDNLYGKISIKLEEADYQSKVKKQLHDINMRRPEPGFRPGKVPASLLERKYGKAVKYDVINSTVSDALFNYINENKVRTMGDPLPEKNDDFDIEAKEFEFSFRIGLFPQLGLKLDKSLTIPYYVINVDDDMVKKEDEMLRTRAGRQVPGDEVEPNALVKGVIEELNEDGTVKEGGIKVENGIVSPQYFKSEEQRNLFIGKKVGDVVRFNPAATCDGNETELSSMLDIPKEETKEHHGDFNLTIKEIIVLRPAELDQEFFDRVFGKDIVHNEEEYYAKLKENIAGRLTADSNYRFSIDAKDALQKLAGDFDLPADALKEVIRHKEENLTPEDVDKRYEEYLPSLKWMVVRDDSMLEMKVSITKEDVLSMAKAVAYQQFIQYGINNVPDDALDRYANQLLENKDMQERVTSQALENKFLAALKDVVTLDEKKVSVGEFNALFTSAEEKAE